LPRRKDEHIAYDIDAPGNSPFEFNDPLPHDPPKLWYAFLLLFTVTNIDKFGILTHFY
jgi:hypothetical protein